MPAFSNAMPVRPDPGDRSAMYRLVSLAFRYPSPEMFESFRDGRYVAELRDSVMRIPYLSALLFEHAGPTPSEVEGKFDGMEYSEFEARYVRTFDAGTPAPSCPPYEHVYSEGNQANVLLEVSEFYKHFGLEMGREEGARELPDHLCAELEFLHFLTFKESQVEQEGASDLLDGYRLAQKDFLERHLARWVPQFCARIEQQSALPFYGWLGRITAGLIASEVGWVDAACREGASRSGTF